MLKTNDLHWLAGWIEGEGSFGFWGRRGHETPRIVATTTDQDIARFAADIIGIDVKGPFPPYGKTAVRFPNAKPQYRVILHGPRAVGWMMTLYGLMGDRRRLQIKDALSQWKSIPPRSSNVTKNRQLFWAERANRN